MSTTSAALRMTHRRVLPEQLPRRVLGVALTLVMIVTLVYLSSRAMPILNPPVTRIEVAGRLVHLTPTQIASAAAIAPGTRFFDVPMKALRARIEALPWVAESTITRQWPDSVNIRVKERQPYARWNGNSLLDTAGQVFAPRADALPAGLRNALPKLSGPPGHEQDVMNAWKKMSAGLAGGPFALAALKQDARGGWVARCRSGVLLRLGRDNPTRKIGLLRNTVAPALASRLKDVAVIDLRYTNGFAVRWTDAADQDQSAGVVAAAREIPK